jgi:hypothetical protein
VGQKGSCCACGADNGLHTHTLVVEPTKQSLAHDHLVGEALDTDDVQAWTHGWVMWLMEQLDTGVLGTTDHAH